MQLIGMLDSPYVRRVAVSLKVLGLPFDLDQVSVFRHFDKFSAINPVVKAPSFVTDDGVVLMDSSLILEHIAHLAPRSLMPADRAAHEIALRQIGLALAACEKTVSILYERNLRPAEKQHQPWLDRVRGQLLAYGALEREASPDWFTGEELMQPQITAAVAWRFTQHNVPELVPAADFPKLVGAVGAGGKAGAVHRDEFSLISAPAPAGCGLGQRIGLALPDKFSRQSSGALDDSLQLVALHFILHRNRAFRRGGGCIQAREVAQHRRDLQPRIARRRGRMPAITPSRSAVGWALQAWVSERVSPRDSGQVV